MHPSSSPPPPSSPPAAVAAGLPAQPADPVRRLIETPPAVVSVMCPAGFTASSVEGVSLDRPLFARVTYRPA